MLLFLFFLNLHFIIGWEKKRLYKCKKIEDLIEYIRRKALLNTLGDVKNVEEIKAKITKNVMRSEKFYKAETKILYGWIALSIFQYLIEGLRYYFSLEVIDIQRPYHFSNFKLVATIALEGWIALAIMMRYIIRHENDTRLHFEKLLDIEVSDKRSRG